MVRILREIEAVVGVRASGAGVLGLEKGYRTVHGSVQGEMAGNEHGGELWRLPLKFSVLQELAFSEQALTVCLSRSAKFGFGPNLVAKRAMNPVGKPNNSENLSSRACQIIR